MARRTNKCWAPPTWRSSTRPIHTTRTLRDTITVTTTLKCARRAGPRHMPQNRAQLGILRSWGMRRTVPRRQMLPISATRTPESSLIDQCCRAAMLTSPCCDTTCQQPWFRNVLAYNENAPYCFQSAPKHTQCCTTWPIIYACKTTTNVDAVRCKWATAKGRQHWLGTRQHKADRSRVSEDLCARKPPTQGTPCNNCVTTPATRVLFPNIKRRQEPRFIKLSSVGGKDALYRALSKKGRFAAACSRNPSPHWKTNGKSTPTKPAADATSTANWPRRDTVCFMSIPPPALIRPRGQVPVALFDRVMRQRILHQGPIVKDAAAEDVAQRRHYATFTVLHGKGRLAIEGQNKGELAQPT